MHAYSAENAVGQGSRRGERRTRVGELRLIKEVVEPEEAERSVGRRMSARDRYVIASAEEPARLTLHVAQPTSLRYNAFKPFSYYVRG